MTISEYLRKYNISIDEKLYIERLKEKRDILLKIKNKGYKCYIVCDTCPLKYEDLCLSCSIATFFSMITGKIIETNVYDENYFKIKSELIEFLIKKASNIPVQEELDV